MKKLISNSLLLLFSFSLCIGLAELLLPLFGLSQRLDYFAPQFPISHPVHGYLSRGQSKGWYERADFTQWLEFNELGHHDYPVSIKSNIQTRLVAAGGSFTAGLEVPVDKTWPKQLDNLLGEKFEVINMAAQARKFSFFARYFDDNFYKTIQPDGILFGFSYGRLSADAKYQGDEPACLHADSYRGFTYFYGSNGPDNARKAIDRIMEFDFLPVRLYELQPWLRRSALMQLALQYQLGKAKNNAELYGVKFQGNIARDRSCDKEYSIENTRANITTILEKAAQYSVPVSFFFIPKRSCYDDSIDAATLIPDYFEKSTAVFDLCENFKKARAESGEELHWRRDDHPNGNGHRLVAESIARHIKDTNYEPSLSQARTAE